MRRRLDIVQRWRTDTANLDRYPLGNVKNEIHVGIVVVVGATWHRDEVVCQLDVLRICLRERGGGWGTTGMSMQTGKNGEEEQGH